MEIKANEAFDIYRELYYEGGVSSVYLWNLDDGFAGVVLLKKCKFGRPTLYSLYSQGVHQNTPPSLTASQADMFQRSIPLRR